MRGSVGADERVGNAVGGVNKGEGFFLVGAGEGSGGADGADGIIAGGMGEGGVGLRG